MNIYIANMPFRLNEADLKKLFTDYGTVTSAKIVTDHKTGKSRGFGFVEMPDKPAANAAIAALNGKEIDSRTLVVNEAKDRPKK